jgi:predicted secreted Zn-dependent protease
MIKASGLLTCFTLALMPCLMVQNAHAETIVHKSYRYFSIHGKTAAELDHQLESKGPHTGQSALRHPGATKIRFGGTMDYVKSRNSCSLDKIKVTVAITIIMPRWTNRSHTTPQLNLIWDTLAADIKRHEERHAEIAAQHARDLDRKLQSLPATANCDEMAQKVSDLTDKVTEEHEADQIRFDRIEAINFNARISRLLQYRSQKQAGTH